MIRVFTAFSGYDSQCLALNELRGMAVQKTGWFGIKYTTPFGYELVGWSEIDKYAIQAHNALFPQWSDRNYGDISKIDWEKVPDFDLFTYSSPCQDFSQAGKQAGGEKGSGTRSSLLWECERAIRIKRPKYLLFENVAAVVSKKFMPLFMEWQHTLEKMGYTNFWQVLNAKTHGYPTPVPQNRKRVFMVSILDCQKPYIFPEEQPLITRLKDVLETNVPEEYYLSKERIKGVIASTRKEQERGNGFKFDPKDGGGIANCIKTSEGSRKTDNFILDMKEEIEPRQNRDNSERSVLGWTRDKRGNIKDRHVVVANSVTATKRDNTQNYVVEKVAQIHPGQNGAVYSPDGISPTICAGEGIKTQTKIIQRPRGFNKGNVFSECPTITKNQWQENNMLIDGLRIRKFTPRECFRLMGVRDEDIDKIQAAGISRTQQCHLAGNSIVVNCIAAVLKNLIEL